MSGGWLGDPVSVPRDWGHPPVVVPEPEPRPTRYTPSIGAGKRIWHADTETFLIAPGLQAPPLVCLQFAYDEDEPQIVHVRDPACRREIVRALEPGSVWNFQNLAFDAAVIMAQYPDLIPAVFDLFERDEAVCTIVRQKLLDIARGRFKVASKRGYNLAQIARAHNLDLGLNKEDPWRLKYGTLIDTPVIEWDPEAIDYARKDVTAQRLVFHAQEAYALSRDVPLVDQFRQTRAALWLRLMECRGMMVDPVRAEAYIAEVRKTLAVDREICEAAGLVRRDGTKDTKAAMRHMVAICREAEEDDLPLTDTAVAALEDLHDGRPPARASWAYWESLPEGKEAGISLNEDSVILYGDELLESYQRYATSTTQLARAERLYLAAKANKPIQATFGTLQDTGRTSCSQGDKKKPGQVPSAYGAQLQNPAKDKKVKRKQPAGYIAHPTDKDLWIGPGGATAPKFIWRRGPRELYVARDGFVFCSTDYDSAELCGVAQECIWKVGYSNLGDVINAGGDAHTELGAVLAGISIDEAYARRKGERGPELKKEFDSVHRQAAKIGNFGFWGGMGAPKLALQARKQYGLPLSATESVVDPNTGLVLPSTKAIKEAFKTRWTEFDGFCKWGKAQLSGPYEDQKGEFVQSWSGRLRGGCWFSALLNTTFQGLISDIKKEACWRISQEMYTGRRQDGKAGVSPLWGCYLVNDVHDEPLSELVESRAHEAAFRQAEIQMQVASRIAPDVKWGCRPALMRRWYKEAGEVYSADGVLIPWEPKKAA